MRVCYQIGDSDLVALRRMYQSQPAGKKAIRREYSNGLFVGLLIGGLGVLCIWLADRRIPLFVMGPVVLGAFALWWHSYYQGLQEKADQAFVRAVASSASGDHVMTLSDEGIHEEQPQGTVFHRWDAVDEIVETAEHVFVCLDSSGTYVVPKRTFSRPETLAPFVAEMRRRVESSLIQ